jgi:hypothetical protein
MAKPLLQRQAELIEYLTSAAAVFGDDSRPDKGPDGFDLRLLRLEARFSYEKRVEKIRAVCAKTFEILGPESQELMRAFVEACPPTAIGRLDNARQFQGFLADRWRREMLDPPYLPDVAGLEIACAAAAVAAGAVEAPPAGSPKGGVRRAPGVVLLRCVYDVRPIFEQGWGGTVPTQRDTFLAVVVPPAADAPQVFELLPPVFELVSALDDVTDPTLFGAPAVMRPLVRELAQLGLVERAG